MGVRKNRLTGAEPLMGIAQIMRNLSDLRFMCFLNGHARSPTFSGYLLPRTGSSLSKLVASLARWGPNKEVALFLSRVEPPVERGYGRRAVNMLQIDIEARDETGLIFIMGGEISGNRIGQLMSSWNEYKALRDGKVCIVDVSKVNAIDPAGETAIRRIARDGARFRASGPMMGLIIDLVCQANLEMLQEGRREFRSIVFCR